MSQKGALKSLLPPLASPAASAAGSAPGSQRSARRVRTEGVPKGVSFGVASRVSEDTASSSRAEEDVEVDASDQNRYIPPFVCPRTGEPLKTFCHTTRELTSLICPIYSHRGMEHELLRDFCTRERQRLVPKREQVDTLLSELHRLRDQVQHRAAKLHQLVDKSVADVVRRLNRRRRALHNDIKARSGALMNTLEAELITRKQELQTLRSAKLTLSLLSSGRGVAPDGDIGGVLRGEHTYDQFLAIGDPALHPAPTIRETLNLSLALQVRDEVLHFDWTAETRNLQPLVYPPKGF